LYAGKDWKDRELGRQSMIMMAEKVLPRVTPALETVQRRGIVGSQSTGGVESAHPTAFTGARLGVNRGCKNAFEAGQ